MSNIKIRKIEKEDANEIIPRLSDVYDKLPLGNESLWDLMKEFDPNISVVVEVDGNIGGFYLLGMDDIPPNKLNPDYETLKTMRGVEGIALGIFPEHKGKGIGKMLIEYPKKLGVDYIWGYQFKRLENIKNWLKRRKLHFENKQLYITYEIF